MLLIRRLLLLLLLLVVSGCQLLTVEQDTQENNPITREIPQEKIQTAKTAEIDEQDEQVLTLGIEGFTEEVKVRRYENDWVSLWVDTSLTMQEKEERVDFNHEDSNLLFSIQRLTPTQAAQQVESLIDQLLLTGYEIIDEFLLEHRPGTGSILYSYEERQSVDIYLLEEKQHNVLVSFVIPDAFMDRFIHRFEHMLHSIELFS